jgi:broad specificity phosphatase PhoE
MAERTDHTGELWLLRHGETEWSRSRQHTGRTDIPLTAEGEKAAAGVAPRLAGVHFDLVLASPLQRATRTAQLAGLDPRPEPDAMEWDYGDYEGRTTADIRTERPGWSIWTDGVPGGESLDDVAARARSVVDRVLAQAPTRAILVAHAHVIRVLAAVWVDAHPDLGQHLALDTASLSVLAHDRGTPVVLRWNT